jgi:hypothetical protein
MKQSAETNEEKKFLSKKRKVIEQEVTKYNRDIKLVEFVCACPDCPYCHNEEMYAHPNRKYCDPEAMLFHRKRKRIEQAIAEGRKPKTVGRPRKNVTTGIIYMLQATDTAFYKIDCADDLATYQSELTNHQRTNPKGVNEIFKVDRPAHQETVDAIYQLYPDSVINDKWLELSEEQVQQIKSLLT